MSSPKVQIILKEIYALGEQGTAVWNEKRKSRNAMWKHIAEIYVFFHKHIKDKATLHDVLELANIQHKRELVNEQLNFGALLRIIWGDDNCSRTELERHGRALNAIHKHYQKKPSLYVKDGVAKLVDFINANGGISGLANSASTENAPSNYNKDSAATRGKSTIKPVEQPSDNAKTRALALEAEEFIATLPVVAPITALEVQSEIQTDRDNLGVLLVRHTNNGFDVIGSSKNADIIRAVKAETYQRSTSGLSLHLRCLLETLKTQCLPDFLQSVQAKLVDNGAERITKGERALAIRRLLYIGDLKQYLLSPSNAHSGVVTIATPIQQDFLDTTDDLILSLRARRRIEKTLISNDEFHLYRLLKPHRPYDYPESNSLAYVARLENSINKLYNFMHLDFWRYEANHKNSKPQLYAHPINHGIKWEADLGVDWFKRLAYNALDKWLDGSGRHINREKQKVCRLTFGKNALKLEFTQVGLGFSIARDVAFTTATKNNTSIPAYFLAKDVVPALRCIADLELDSTVRMAVTDDMLCMEYSTPAGAYSVFVPKASDTGVRQQKQFEKYTPKQFTSFELEQGIVDDEQEFER